MICHLRELVYEFEYLGTTQYDIEGNTSDTPSILLVDNEATVQMAKHYKVTSKNRHVARRWHFVQRGQEAKKFKVQWIPAKDQLADDGTKIQPASIAKTHMNRTILPVPDRVRGYVSNVVGNR